MGGARLAERLREAAEQRRAAAGVEQEMHRRRPIVGAAGALIGRRGRCVHPPAPAQGDGCSVARPRRPDALTAASMVLERTLQARVAAVVRARSNDGRHAVSRTFKAAARRR